MLQVDLRNVSTYRQVCVCVTGRPGNVFTYRQVCVCVTGRPGECVHLQTGVCLCYRYTWGLCPPTDRCVFVLQIDLGNVSTYRQVCVCVTGRPGECVHLQTGVCLCYRYTWGLCPPTDRCVFVLQIDLGNVSTYRQVCVCVTGRPGECVHLQTGVCLCYR